jgi:ribosomal protein S18 acetylase RimI-like enzyme
MKRNRPAVIYRHLTMDNFNDVTALWQNTENIGLSQADSYEQISKYLERNPELSCIALVNSVIVGAVLCGHDGRRGCIYHLAVDPHFRGFGIGKKLVNLCLDGLANAQIERCHIHVYADNQTGLDFWKNSGWFLRPELELLSIDIAVE